jgi:hypothetical protein
VIANSQPRSVSTACPDLSGEPRRANSERLLRDATRLPRASFANGRPITRCASFGCFRFQLCTIDSRPSCGSRRVSEAQKRAPITPLFAILTDSLSRNSFPCHSYANTRGVGISSSIFRSRFGTPDRTRDTRSSKFCALAFARVKSFRIRSYGKCACNSFRIRSYKIPRGVESPSQPLSPSRLSEGTAKVPSFRLANYSQLADASSATRAYPIHPMSIARSGVQVHG